MKDRSLFVACVVLLCLGSIPAAGQEERSPAVRAIALKAERLAAHAHAAGPVTTAKTVAVDCSKGGSISAALAKNAGPLVIEVHGICTENVRIERNDLTIGGTDPLADGIRGVTADPQPMALEFWYANRARLENISVSDGPAAGVGAWFSNLDMLNCRIERNGGTGIHISASSALAGTELVVSQNTNSGINAQRVGWVTCLGCRFEGNTPWAATSRDGGFMTLWDSVVSGVRGIMATDGGSYVDVDCITQITSYPCSVNAQNIAARATTNANASLWGVGSFSGRVQASSNGGVGLFGAQQTLSEGMANGIWDSGQLTTDVAEEGGPATTLGRTSLERFARATLWNATVLSDTLSCSTGADAFSDTPYPATKVAGCQNVPIQ